MNIVEAPNMLQYSDPTQWVREKILPVEQVCGKCKSKLILDHESDIYVTSSSGKPVLGYTCMVCGSNRVWTRPSDESREEAQKYVHLSDEEYAEVRTKRILERAKKREQYLSAEKKLNSWTYHHWERYESSKYPTFEKYIEDKFLPEVPPETRTELSSLMRHYDEVLEYYQKQANTPKNITSSVANKSKGSLFPNILLLGAIGSFLLYVLGFPVGLVMAYLWLGILIVTNVMQASR